MNIAIYARYSSSKQTEQSIEGQLHACHDFCKRNNYLIAKEYIDRAASGTNDNRPAFQEMLHDATTGLFQMIIVYQFDRFARNRRDSLNNKFFLSTYGVKVVSATEPLSDDPTSMFAESILETAAEYYSRDLSRKTVRGLKESLLKNQTTGGIIPLGYKTDGNKHIIIDEEEAHIVRRIFKEYVEEEKQVDIVNRLNNEGITRRGSLFSVHTVHHTLKNTRYVGKYINPYTKEICNLYPAIVDDKTFLLAQERLNNKKNDIKSRLNKGSGENDNYVLTGKLFCGYCGNAMVGTSGYSSTKKLYRYYKCKTKKCKKSAEKKDFIEWYVAEQIVNYLKDPLRLDYIVNEMIKQLKDAKKDPKLAALQAKEKQKQKELNKIVDSFIDATSDIMRSQLNVRSQKLDEELKALDYEIQKQKILNNDKIIDPKFVKSFVLTFLSQEQDTTVYYSRLFKFFLNSVYLFDDKVIIYLNFENTKIVSYIEMLADVDRLTKEKANAAKRSHKVANGTPSTILNELLDVWIHKDIIGLLIIRNKNA